MTDREIDMQKPTCHLPLFTLLALLLIATQTLAKPDVIAHRGASGYLPEHTLEAAIMAYVQGADFIEQDLVMSKDGHLIVLHDIHLETVTNVEEVFPDRHRQDNRYYALDFTLQELKKLHVHERQDAQGKQVFSGRFAGLSEFRIATFRQQIELIGQLNRQFDKQVGLYPEIKSPQWHRQQGVDISKAVLKVLREYQLDTPSSEVYLQCFDFDELKRIRNELNAKVKLVQLIAENSWAESTTDYDWLKTSQGLAEVAQIAQGIGPWIPQLVNPDTLQPSEILTSAKQLGLVIHPYTFRQDQLPKDMSRQQLLDLLFKQLKVDGVFTDFTDTVVDYLN